VKERPILFSAPMVRAVLDGRKTQTRRLVKPQPDHHWQSLPGYRLDMPASDLVNGSTWRICPYGVVGDRLWVRETWGLLSYTDETEWHRGSLKGLRDQRTFWDVAYRAEYGLGQMYREPDRDTGRWRPSIYMPCWASRLTLEITGVRVERLNDIGEADAIAEGIEREGGGWRNYLDTSTPHLTPQASFATLWESINGGNSWAANPWVWVVQFRRVTKRKAETWVQARINGMPASGRGA